MRGDRPYEPITFPGCVKATPHARGSTHNGVGHDSWREGYPACAGIDLRGRVLGELIERLPRMRGDRPHLGVDC